MRGLKTCTLRLAMTARFRRRMSSSVLPENIGPQMTSSCPKLLALLGGEAQPEVGVDAALGGPRFEDRVAQAGRTVVEEMRSSARHPALLASGAFDGVNDARHVYPNVLLPCLLEDGDADALERLRERRRISRRQRAAEQSQAFNPHGLWRRGLLAARWARPARKTEHRRWRA